LPSSECFTCIESSECPLSGNGNNNDNNDNDKNTTSLYCYPMVQHGGFPWLLSETGPLLIHYFSAHIKQQLLHHSQR